MAKYRLTESRLRGMIKESIRGVLSELDWKTYMNAARKRDERGDYRAASELEKYAQQMFQKQHGKNGHSYNYEYDLPTSYQGRYHRWKNGETWASDYNFDVKAPTEEGWWNGEYADTKRSYRYGNGFPHMNYGELHDDTFDYAANNKEGWDGSQHRKHTMIYDKDGERYNPDLSTVGNEISLSKDDDYNARQRRMAQDMEDYYTGKSQYINGKGWARKDESIDRKLHIMIREAAKSALNEGDIYKEQWDYETKLFLNGLNRGNAIEFSEDTIAVEYPQGRAYENDPRYITYTFGDGRLRDNHFSAQHSPYLDERTIRMIEWYMVEKLGMEPQY